MDKRKSGTKSGTRTYLQRTSKHWGEVAQTEPKRFKPNTSAGAQ
jgi:hypothetical protein